MDGTKNVNLAIGTFQGSWKATRELVVLRFVVVICFRHFPICYVSLIPPGPLAREDQNVYFPAPLLNTFAFLRRGPQTAER